MVRRKRRKTEGIKKRQHKRKGRKTDEGKERKARGRISVRK